MVRSKSLKQQQAEEVIRLVKSLRNQMLRLGTRKLYKVFHEPLRGVHVGRDKLLSILNVNHMRIKQARQYRTIANSHHRFRKHKTWLQVLILLDQNKYEYQTLHILGLQAIITIYHWSQMPIQKKIVGYNLSNNLNTECVLAALDKALKKRIYKDARLIHYSDSGIQYCSDEYQKKLQQNKIITNMIETFNPYANAIVERVKGIIKSEFALEKCAYNSCAYVTGLGKHRYI